MKRNALTLLKISSSGECREGAAPSAGRLRASLKMTTLRVGGRDKSVDIFPLGMA